MDLKTLVEVRAARVSVIEDDGGTTVSIMIPSASNDWGSTPDEANEAGKVPLLGSQVEDLLAENKRVSDWAHGLEVKVGELVADKDALLLKVKNMESDLSEYAEGLDISIDKVRALVAERDALLLKVEGYDNDRKTEKQRANENQGWAERTEAHLEVRTRERDEARANLSRIRVQVWDGALDESIEHRGRPAAISVGNVGKLAEAVSVIRSIVGQP